jgi:osmotically-inducible protein OsmY
MIRVSSSTSDQATAWRVRDAMARHPLLGGAIVQIYIHACRDGIVLDGWVLDDGLLQLAIRIARQAAGSRPVAQRLHVRQQVKVPQIDRI